MLLISGWGDESAFVLIFTVFLLIFLCNAHIYNENEIYRVLFLNKLCAYFKGLRGVLPNNSKNKNKILD